MTEEGDPSSPFRSSIKETVENPLKDFELFISDPIKVEKLQVHDATCIRAAISRHMASLRVVDSQRALLDKVSLKDVGSEEGKNKLMARIKTLRDQFDERKHQILSR